MSLRITHNVEAMNSYNTLSKTSAAISKSMQRLSSGYRINSAADDAAGLGISESHALADPRPGQAQKNIQDGASMIQTAEGNLDEVHSMLQRVRELAVQYKNGSLDANARTAIQTEVNQLASEISRIGDSASVQRHQPAEQHRPRCRSRSAPTTARRSRVAWSTWRRRSARPTRRCRRPARRDISEIDTAITAVSTARATFGAVQNRLDHSLSVAATYQENLTVGGVADPRRGHGGRDGRPDQEPDPLAGRHRDALRRPTRPRRASCASWAKD